jgi:hypothetical protein
VKIPLGASFGSGDWLEDDLLSKLLACSRKIVGRSFSPEATSHTVQLARWKALANEGLLAEEDPGMPLAHSDRGAQMTSRSTRVFFFDLGIAQSFSRPRTPTDKGTDHVAAQRSLWVKNLGCALESAIRGPWRLPRHTSHGLTAPRSADVDQATIHF